MVSALGLRLRSHGSGTPTAVGGQPGRGALSAPRSGAAVPVRCHATAVAGSISQSWGAPDVVATDETPFGTGYTVEGALLAPDGRTPRVRVVWFIETGEVVPRLVTAYPLKEAKT